MDMKYGKGSKTPKGTQGRVTTSRETTKTATSPDKMAMKMGNAGSTKFTGLPHYGRPAGKGKM